MCTKGGKGALRFFSKWWPWWPAWRRGPRAPENDHVLACGVHYFYLRLPVHPAFINHHYSSLKIGQNGLRESQSHRRRKSAVCVRHSSQISGGTPESHDFDVLTASTGVNPWHVPQRPSGAHQAHSWLSFTIFHIYARFLRGAAG